MFTSPLRTASAALALTSMLAVAAPASAGAAAHAHSAVTAAATTSATKATASAASTKRQRARALRALRKLQYRGATGTVVHARTSVYDITGTTPSSPTVTESWFEIGGGRRWHATGTKGPEFSFDNWAGARFRVEQLTQRDARGRLRTSTGVLTWRCDLPGDGGHPDYAFAFSRKGELAGLPAGPQVRGRATRIVRPAPSAPWFDATSTLYVDAETGAPMQVWAIDTNGGVSNPHLSEDYALWEIVPQPDPAVLSGTLGHVARLADDTAGMC